MSRFSAKNRDKVGPSVDQELLGVETTEARDTPVLPAPSTTKDESQVV